MQSDVGKISKAGGLLGIRPGAWLVVLGLALLCVLAISLFRRQAITPPGKMISDLKGGAGGVSANSAHSNAWRPIRRLSASSSAHEGARQASATLTADEVRTLARAMANEKARELYDCEPFQNGPLAERVEEGWVWFDRRARGPADIEATVHFAADGSAHSVDVILLDTRPERFR